MSRTLHLVLVLLAAGAVLSFASPASASPAQARALFQQAKEQWVAEAVVGGGAAEATVLELAIADLQDAIRADHSLAPSYGAAIASISDLASIPDASLTPAQEAEASKDTRTIGSFFGPSSGRTGVLRGHWYLEASRAWYKEPGQLSRGIVNAHVRQAVSDLRLAIKDKEPGSAYIPAAIWDLKKLESASRSLLTHAETNNYGAELAFLNIFFSFNQLFRNPVLQFHCVPPMSGTTVNCD